MYLRFEEAIQTFDKVGNVTEAARLHAATFNEKGLISQRAGDELRHGTPITAPHSRTISIENADNAGVQLVITMVGHGHSLRKAFRFIVNCPWPDRVDVAEVVFALRVYR